MLTNIDGLANITSPMSSTNIEDNAALTNVDGLEGITSIRGNLSVQDNPMLADIDGLAGITSITNDLYVRYNGELSRCNCGLYDLLTTSGAVGGVVDISSNAIDCSSETEVVEQGPCGAGDCTTTVLAEGAPYVGADGAGRVDLTFSTPDGIEEIDFSLLDNLTLETSTPAFDAKTTSGDGLPTYTYGTAPKQIDITLVQQNTGNESAGYFGIARSLCPWVDGDQLAVEFDPPLEFALQAPERLMLSGAYPNPTPGGATVSFALPAASDVRLTVYDAVGRHVATLARGTMEAGRHELRWDGRSDSGAPLSSGLYLMRLDAGGQSRTSRITIVR